MNPIFERVSVRKFSDVEVSDSQIESLLKAGMQAPSACNQQPWEFIIVSDKNDKTAISEMHKFAKPAAESSRLIVVLGNLKEARLSSMMEQDLAACCENILLQAVIEGLGGVWLGFYPIEERCMKIRKYLNIPDYCIPFAVICVGYPIHEKHVKLRYDDSKVHLNRF